MPSMLDPPEKIPRRQILTGVGTVGAGALAGCTGQLPGTGPARLDAETTKENDRILWRYPPREGDTEGIGYAAIELDRIIQRDNQPPMASLKFNSTVGRLASSEPYRGYRPDWFRFQIWPPTSYDGRVQYHLRVEPPGQWEDFSTYYDIEGSVRGSIIELHDIDTQGTIIVPAIFDPGTKPLPGSLHCSFTVQATRPGLLGKTVRVTEQGTLALEQR